MELRKKLILKAVIDNYIKTADPVGSKSIADKAALNLSPATIRNEMAELEDLGYLEQPHTSAGRVPSPAGYRFYVDELMEQHRLSGSEIDEINAALRIKTAELDRMISEAGRLLSRLTHYAAYTISPALDDEVRAVRRVELIYVDEFSMVALLVLDMGIVKNKLIRLRSPVGRQDAADLSAVLNRVIPGLSAKDITPELSAYILSLCRSAEPLITPVMNFISEIFSELSGGDVYVSGTTELLNQPEYKDIYKARGLIDYLSGESVGSLPPPSPGEPMQIIIGPENIAAELKNSSVIMARYSLGGNMQGLLGIVGPTRMDYSRMASRLSYFAKKLEKIFHDDNDNDPPEIGGG